MTSQLRIQSILSPPEPPDADAASATPTSAQQPTSKRNFHDAFAAPIEPLPHHPLHPAPFGNAAADDGSRSPGPATIMAASRASIACHRCHELKAKCSNTGGDGPCERCTESNHSNQCTYPEVAPYTFEFPAKKQSRWSLEEDTLLLELRGKHMGWKYISSRLNRSCSSCRQRYHIHLKEDECDELFEWDEERKNELARWYKR